MQLFYIRQKITKIQLLYIHQKIFMNIQPFFICHKNFIENNIKIIKIVRIFSKNSEISSLLT